MKTAWIVLAACAAFAGPARPDMRTDAERISYSLGLEMARNLRKNGVEFDAALVLQGLKDGEKGDRTLLSEKELKKVLSDFQTQVRQRVAANTRILSVENRQRSDAFLQENKSRDGVFALANGLQFKVLQAGSGDKPKVTDTVQLNYRATLLDGMQFDGTEPGKPGTTKVLQLFTGFAEALKLMPAGSHWTVWIPPQLAYGDRGVGSDIGPNALLTYDIELLKVLPAGERP